MTCIECGRSGRPNRTSKADYPGTVLIVARGMCSACYSAHRKMFPSQHGASITTSAVEHQPDIADIPCVLVRVDLTPATFKALRLRNVDISALLSKAADHFVKGL